MKIHQLTDRAIGTARAGTHNDGQGLTLRVGANGKRSWVLRYVWEGKAAAMGLGSYPMVGLKEARSIASDHRAELAEGRKPAGTRGRPPEPAKPTFRAIAEKVIELRSLTWSSDRHATQWTESLTNHAYPIIGDKLMEEISSGDVLAMLSPIWTSHPETATRVKQRTQIVFDFAVASGLRHDNPVAAVGKALPRRPRLKEHHKAVSYADLHTTIEAIRASTAHQVTRLALEFIILTAARTGEVRGMVWSEVDGATWTVPAVRMKMRRAHRVPLSGRAMEILRLVKGLGLSGPLVFPGSKRGKQLSNMSFVMLLRRIGASGVTHGFRSRFKDWALAETSTPWAVSEAALAHNLGNSMEAAYARTDLFERRRGLMDAWAGFLAV